MLLITSNMQSHAESLQQALQDGDQAAALAETRYVSPLRTARILSDVPKDMVKPFLLAVPQAHAAAIVANFPAALSFSVLEELPREQVGSLSDWCRVIGRRLLFVFTGRDKAGRGTML